MNVDFRQTLLSILDLPSDTTDDGILASVTALVAKSAALTRVECLAWKAESKCNDTMWTEDVLAALRGESR